MEPSIDDNSSFDIVSPLETVLVTLISIAIFNIVYSALTQISIAKIGTENNNNVFEDVMSNLHFIIENYDDFLKKSK